MNVKQVTVRRIGYRSLYMCIPIAWVRANDLKNNDLAYLIPIEGRPDKFEVTLVKAPVPQELVAQRLEAAEEAVG
jgi:hypothetical protein